MNALTRELHLFFNALTFFTRIPAPAWVKFGPDELNHASRYFPLAGLIIGLAAAALYAIFALLFPATIAVLLSTGGILLLTGGFHEDGLADLCDGFGGGWTPQQTLEIMKDSRLGSYGALGLIIVLGLKLASLISINDVLIALIAGHTLSRFVAVSLIHTDSYVQLDRLSKVRPLASNMSRTELLIATAPALACLFLLPGYSVLAVITALLLLRLYLCRLFRRRLGGYTGDCLGATQQLAEVAVYLVLCLPLGQL
ncbi:adenosylcobinamide-GDP ribazoletransferase [Marinobacterium sedimentorum]|uniref:adenosylcobinamide-GDP ribazoletransferase n=1 Tax=Marinobacterium sedimentorum TaxID=2927804 RepID=UPI0020C72A6A|nr:adenosylcobinamide-GDP ribazoletransferase [Marinobacterium sedimentorum]MCP8686914.1 adenosylcobinamide-GDP ribazoletransferase [Marinobacterium sedimentorum]